MVQRSKRNDEKRDGKEKKLKKFKGIIIEIREAGMG